MAFIITRMDNAMGSYWSRRSKTLIGEIAIRLFFLFYKRAII